jgi:uncharacterized phage-associated protein
VNVLRQDRQRKRCKPLRCFPNRLTALPQFGHCIEVFVFAIVSILQYYSKLLLFVNRRSTFIFRKISLLFNGLRVIMNLAMKLAFDEMKATQAAALFMKLAGNSMNYMALIKLLYRADREAFRRCGLPITTDEYVSMKLGPVTSNIYDRIKSSLNPNVRPTVWSAHIQHTADQYVIQLKAHPGDSELSPIEEEIIKETFTLHGHKGPFTLADECHKEFPEWENPGESSCPIDISDILAALNLSEDEAAHVECMISKQRAAFSLAA